MVSDVAEISRQAVEFAEGGGEIVMSYFRASLDVEAKADDSPVTIADRKAEAFIRDKLAVAFPDDGIFGEEFGTHNLDANAVWIVDPIDGTRSFITGHPLFGTLLGRYVGGDAQIGIVHMPATGESFVGAKGGGATLNGRPIECRNTAALSDAMLYINDSEKLILEDAETLWRLRSSVHTCRLAYDCYSHALVAAGHVDAVIDQGLEPYDYMPLVGLIEAAGGVMCDWQGNSLGFDSDGHVITAATPNLRDKLLEILNN